MPTVTAQSEDISLSSRRSGKTWSKAEWAVALVLSSAIPANAQVTSATLNVNIKTPPIVAANVYVDGQAVRTTSSGVRSISIAVAPGVSSRDVAMSYQAYGTDYSLSIVVLSLSLSVTYIIPVSAATAPTAVSVSGTVAEGNAILSWSGAGAGVQNAITGYEIQHRDSANGTSWGDWSAEITVSITAASGSTTVSINPTRGAYRMYRVRTMGAAGSAYYSAWAQSQAVRTNELPTMPEGVTALPTVYESGSITLAWKASSDTTDSVAQYRIRSRTSTDGTTWSAWVEAGTTTALTVTFSPSLARGAKIQYAVYAVDTFGVASALSASVTITRNSLPNAPENLNVSPVLYESGNVSLSWSASIDPDKQAVKYRVSRQTSSDGGTTWSDSVALGTVEGTTYTDTPTLSRGAKARYLVAAVDSLGAASENAVSAVVTRNSLPSTPANITATPMLYESGGIALSWGASVDPDANLAGYDVQRQISADGKTYGDWVDTVSLSANTAVLSPSLARGSYIRFRVRARDGLGAVSAWVEMQGAVRRNRVPDAPVIIAANALEAMAQQPCFTVRASAEPDGESMTLQYMLQTASGAQVQGYNAAKTLAPSGKASFRASKALDAGTYRVIVRLVDASGGASATASAEFTVAAPVWGRAIAQGDVIASEAVSHRADITEMLAAVNACRARFGLQAMALPGRLGFFADWLSQMQALARGMNECYALLGETVEVPQQPTNYPRAETVNAIRALVEGV